MAGRAYHGHVSAPSNAKSMPTALPTPLGRQALAELYDCPGTVLADLAAIERHMNDAAIAAGATVVESTFHHFNPHGVSGVVIIAESHLAIHTWPEHGYAALDVFTCGDAVDPQRAVEYLYASLGAGRMDLTVVRRGTTLATAPVTSSEGANREG